MKPSPAICVVGSINMDLVFRTPRMPVAGETISGHEFLQIAGGKGANQAVAAARQGAHTTLVGCVGDDANGLQSLDGLKRDGIDINHINTITGCATGVAGIFVDDQARNCIVIAPGANARLTPDHVDNPALRKAQLLICQCETPVPTIQAAMEIAQRHGVEVVFNPAPAIDLPDAIFKLVNYLVVNETEATQISGVAVNSVDTARDAAQKLLTRGVHCVLLTLGDQGVCVCSANEFHHIPAIKVQAVDTTAAGDTFVGAFATAIGQGLTALEAAREAQYSAALTVTRIGAQSSIPHRAEVEQFKASHS